MSKPVHLRQLAAGDIETALVYYLTEAGPDITTRFIAAVERAILTIGRHPHQGSLRFAFELEIPGLRSWPVARFPYLVFYLEREGQIEIWRVLHTRRDIPTTLADTDER